MISETARVVSRETWPSPGGGEARRCGGRVISETAREVSREACSLVGVEEVLEWKEGGRESSLDTSDPREVAMVVSREMCSCLASRLEGSATKLSEETEVRQLLEERERKGWGARCFPTPPSCLGAGGAAPQEGGSQISGHWLLRTFFWEALEVVEVLVVVLVEGGRGGRWWRPGRSSSWWRGLQMCRRM